MQLLNTKNCIQKNRMNLKAAAQVRTADLFFSNVIVYPTFVCKSSNRLNHQSFYSKCEFVSLSITGHRSKSREVNQTKCETPTLALGIRSFVSYGSHFFQDVHKPLLYLSFNGSRGFTVRFLSAFYQHVSSCTA